MIIKKTDIDNKIFSHIGENGLFANCTGVVLAVSGGSDSMAMLRFFIDNRDSFNFPFAVAHINHKLRKESDAEEAAVKEFCKQNDVVFCTVSVDIAAKKRNASTEDFARNVRYAFFDIVRTEFSFSHIATAHNANDNTETFFFNMIRGCGPSGACGIPTVRDDLVVRPLLCCTKEETVRYCKETHTPFFIDKTNAECVYSRNKIRNIIIPEMKNINPSLDTAVEHFISTVSDDESYLVSEAKKRLAECGDQLLTADIEGLPQSILSRIVRLKCKEFGINMTYKQTIDITRLIRRGRTSDKIQINDKFIAIKRYDRVDILNTDNIAADVILLPKTQIKIGVVNLLGEFEILVSETTVTAENVKDCFVYHDVCPIYIRSRESGDRITLLDRPGKTIKKLFTDDKIPSEERSGIPVIATDDEVVWLSGYGANKGYYPRKGKRAFHVSIKKLSNKMNNN